MTVIVLCDRGIASPKLWRQIRAQGWHPYMRYRKNVSFCAQDGRRLPAQHFVSRPDTAWIGRGTAFSTPPQNAAAPCWRSGTSSRKNPGSSSLTCHRRTPDPVGTPCASGWDWASRPSKAWAGSGTKPGAPTPGAAGTDRQRHPPRHRLAEAVAAPRTLWNRVWLLPEPWPEPKPALEITHHAPS